MSGVNRFSSTLATSVTSSAFSTGSNLSGLLTNAGNVGLLNDLILGNLGGFVGGGSGGGSGGIVPTVPTAPTTPAPSVAGSSTLDLQLLIAALPFAEEGAVIRPEYHNSIVQVLQLMARLMGVGPVSSALMLTVAPNFLPISDSDVTLPGWVVGRGVATRSAAASANGWIPVTLPSGARITRMTVRGRRGGTIASCVVRLERQALTLGSTIGDVTPIIEVQLNNVTTDPFEKVGLPTGPTLEAIDEARTVDNTKYAYAVSAELLNASEGAVVELHPFQIEYGAE